MLNAKEKHQLRKALTLLIESKDEIKRFCEHANANNANISLLTVDLDGSPWNKWGNLLIAINDQSDKLIKLLEAITFIEYKDDKILNYFLSELKSRNELRLKELVSDIINKKCVIFLGPDVLQVKNNSSFNKYLCNILKKNLDNNTIYYENKLSDNLSYLSQCYIDMPKYFSGDVQRLAKVEFNKLLNQRKIDKDLFDQISNIPCRLIINEIGRAHV